MPQGSHYQGAQSSSHHQRGRVPARDAAGNTPPQERTGATNDPDGYDEATGANTEIELALLSCLLKDPESLFQRAVDANLSPSHFYLPLHQRVYAAALRLYKDRGHQAVNILDLVDAFIDAQKGRSLPPTIIQAISDIPRATPTSANFSGYLARVQELHLCRRLGRGGALLSQLAATTRDPKYILSKTLEELHELQTLAHQIGSNGSSIPPGGETLTELLAAELPPLRYLIEPIIPEGLSMIVANPKAGKSVALQQIALSAACGAPALGYFPTPNPPTGNILYLSYEDGRRRVQARQRRWVGPDTLQEVTNRITFHYKWPNHKEGGMEALSRWVSLTPNPILIVIDTWGWFVGKPESGKNSDRYQIDRNELAPLKRLADDTPGLSIVCVHHTNKNPDTGEDPFRSISGTQAILGTVDTALLFQHPLSSLEGSITVTGREVEAQTYKLAWDPSHLTWTCRGTAREVGFQGIRQHIIDALSEAYPNAVNYKDIAETINAKPNTTKARANELVHSGIIEARGSGYYAALES